MKWHYRSRHEGLIAFSNRQYYEDKLLTFPGAIAESPTLGVSWREVPDGYYEGGGARTNRKEAEAVVAEVVRRLTDPEEEQRSIGIVTFSLAQQTLVEDLLERARADRPEIDRFFTQVVEPVFVKNLETVQGDERDVILFSICYGPDVDGKVALRFGPLNAKGGERRLNVAITRARQQLVVFSRLRPEQIDLSRTNAIGVADLKAFLEYAQKGPAALRGSARQIVGQSCESPFEEAVFRALTARGWILHKQVGCSGYRIDLAVVDPELPGRYILGIECDGANYHSSRTARDRDRLRASVLESLGWKLHRIWSSDWWLEPERQLARVEDAIREAAKKGPAVATTRAPSAPVENARMAITPSRVPPASVPEAPATRFASQAAPPRSSSVPATAASIPYSVFSWPALQFSGNADFDDYTSGNELGRCIGQLVAHEGPIAFSLLAKRVMAASGVRRGSDKLLRRIRQCLTDQPVTVEYHGERSFVWSNSLRPGQLKAFRYSPGPFARDADEICPEEVALACGHVMAAHFSLEREELLKETARQFGFQRVGANVRSSVDEGIQYFVKSGRATVAGTTITLRRA